MRIDLSGLTGTLASLLICGEMVALGRRRVGLPVALVVVTAAVAVPLANWQRFRMTINEEDI